MAKEPSERKTVKVARHPFTDLGNVDRFVQMYGDKARYSEATGWMTYDGARWSSSSTSALHMACEVVRAIDAEAEFVDDDDVAASIRKWGYKSQSAGRIEAIPRIAKSDPRIYVPTDALDRDPLALNVENGTIDLATGKLRQHDQRDYITRIANVRFDRNATCPRWIEFLNEIMDGNDAMVGSLQQICGYALTGLTSARCMFILHGCGANGKSVFVDTMRSILGDYALVVPATTLMAKDKNAPTNDIAALRGRRLVLASESDASAKLAEGLVKSVTGDRSVTARFLYKEFFEFEPEFKLILATNHKPMIRGTDPAIWTRIKLLPFAVTIPESERIPDLDRILAREAPGILNWCITGCLAFLGQNKRLRLALEIEAATNEYRDESDIIGQFLNDCVVRSDDDTNLLKTIMYAAYVDWCDETGHRPLAANRLSIELSSRGFNSTRIHSGRAWENTRLIVQPSFSRASEEAWDDD